VQILRTELVDMKAERQAHEMQIERQRREAQRQKISAFVHNRASKIIQAFWRSYQVAKKKAMKGAKKGKGKK
jgi:galactose-1-phosphate uridylyltransferase